VEADVIYYFGVEFLSLLINLIVTRYVYYILLLAIAVNYVDKQES
jgi:hypothetical protein